MTAMSSVQKTQRSCTNGECRVSGNCTMDKPGSAKLPTESRSRDRGSSSFSIHDIMAYETRSSVQSLQTTSSRPDTEERPREIENAEDKETSKIVREDSVRETSPEEQILSNKHQRFRILFTGRQLSVLRDAFHKSPYPSYEERIRLGQALGMTHKSVKQWFQNARSKVKKRGTDHVTGFYANRLEARQAMSKDNNPDDAVFKYGRFLIPGMKLEDRDSSKHESKRLKSSHDRCQLPKYFEQATIVTTCDSYSTRKSPEMDPESDTPECVASCSSEEASADLKMGCLNSLSPSVCIKERSAFQQMTQQFLPADHPFCNLDNPEYIWPRGLMACPTSGSCDTDPLFKLTNGLCTVSPQLTTKGRSGTKGRKQLFTGTEVKVERSPEWTKLDCAEISDAGQTSPTAGVKRKTSTPVDDEPLDLSIKSNKRCDINSRSNEQVSERQSRDPPLAFVRPQLLFCPTALRPLNRVGYQQEGHCNKY